MPPQEHVKPVYPLITIASATVFLISLLLFTPKSSPQPQLQTTPKQTQYQLFLTKIPSPLEKITVDNLPSIEDPYDALKYQNRLIFSTQGHIVDYDPNLHQIFHYSDRTIARCLREKVIVSHYLYIPCDEAPTYPTDYGDQTLWQIDLTDFSVTKVYSQASGINSASNLLPVADGDTIWLGSFDGLSKFDTKTEKFTTLTSQLGIFATHTQVNKILVDDSHVWFYIPANAYSSGGITLFDKTTNIFTPFNFQTFVSPQYGRFDLNQWKLTPKGLLIAYSDDHIYKEQLYNYQTNQWQSVKSESFDNYEKNISNFKTENSIEIPYENPRSYLALSPTINNKRFALTNKTIDLITPSDPFPTIQLKFPEDLTNIRPSYNAKDGILFYIDPETELAIVIANVESGYGELPSQMYIVDLKQNTILKNTSLSSEKFPYYTMIDAHAEKINGQYQIFNDTNTSPFLVIDAKTFEYNFK